MFAASKTAGAVSAEVNYIEDVYSTFLYTGNGSTQTITNGIDLSTKGGLVWIKDRTAANSNVLFDTARGANNRLISNLTNAQSTETDAVTSFNTNGFSIGASAVLNTSSNNLASWTFRKQPKFFDVQTFTDSPHQAQTINHNLGATPAMVILKSTSNVDNWYVYHTSLGTSKYMTLNATGGSSSFANWISVSSTQVTIAASFLSSGASYVMYLYASNAGGFGLTGTDNVITCGSYTGNGSATGPVINLGYEPQFVMIKNTTAAGNWVMLDVMRGLPVGDGDAVLYANVTNAETSLNYVNPLSTGFELTASATYVNTSGSNYIYIAIRRGPMKVPTSGTSVFSPNATSGTTDTQITTNFPLDLNIVRDRTASTGFQSGFAWSDRLRGLASTNTATTTGLQSTNTNAETTGIWGLNKFVDNIGFKIAADYSGLSQIYYSFRRAPSFFDEICFLGTGVAMTVNHNLGVTPELMIVKGRSGATGWVVYTAGTGATKYMRLDLANSAATLSAAWNNTAPTSSVFTVGDNSSVNTASATYVAYLFATCAGVSKVGSYTGTGTTLQVNCGFTGGARFVLIKRTDSTGDWYVWDTARGIVSGNDPYLLLNSTAAEVTSTDYIDTYSAGFEISSTAPTAINASGGTFIFLAIA